MSGAPNPEFWSGRRVFVTGSTGFKGSWLSFWLNQMGARVFGYALPPNTTPALFDVLALGELIEQTFDDVRDLPRLERALQAASPAVVFHLAAQPLVRESYLTPVETYATNVMGTVHLLDAVRRCPSVEAVVVVTSDKCYENHEWVWGYRESEAMGGHDPYSSSKGAAELVTAAYRSSFFGNGASKHQAAIASARAGNVLGGGDWAVDRLIPDAVRAFSRGEVVSIRNPSSTRPWQHVLEPLRGYLLLAEAAVGAPESFAEPFNFGPDECDVIPVGEVMTRFVRAWGEAASWRDDSEGENGPHEAGLLKLDSAKARSRLRWRPRLGLDTCLEITARWSQAFLEDSDVGKMRTLTAEQITGSIR